MSSSFKCIFAGAAAMFAIAAAAIAAAPSSAQAGYYYGNGGRTAVWMYVRKHPSEDIWEACRRVYGRDVYQVRGAGPRKARCFVDASQVGNPQGFYHSDGRD